MIHPHPQIAGLPAQGRLNDPKILAVADGSLTMSASGRTDWTINPMTSRRSMDAPAVVFPAPDCCILSARVEVTFDSTFDAGCLVAYQSDDMWAKLCFEYSPQGHPAIVSIVTQGFSDECSSVELRQDFAYLRVARSGASFVMHYSLDGSYWNFVRRFALGETAGLSLGLLAQSPRGSGVTAAFSDIRYALGEIRDIRSGA